MQTNDPSRARTTLAWRWPAAIITLLCLHAAAMVAVIVVATRDPSFAVEPNSYDKAVAWDSSHARRHASEQLGWAARIVTEGAADDLGRRLVRCELKDKNGVPVAAATVNVELFHHARAADRVQATLNPEPHGVYSAWVPMKRTGTWEVRVSARRGQEMFSSTITHDVEGHS